MTRRNTVATIASLKGRQPVVCLTAYTAPVARLADKHADLVLVGDSLGMVLYGMDSTVTVTLDMMIAHGRAVVKSTHKALVVVDMPFGTAQESPEQAYRNAVTVMQQTGCAAVKIEGGAEMAETVAFLVQRGVPVMGHVGMQPQSVNVYGGFAPRGRTIDDRSKIVSDAAAIEKAGAFSIVLECVPGELAAEITARANVPVIGIGAGSFCDGQILVTEDLLGFTGGYVPSFVKKYESLYEAAEQAVAAYADEVRRKLFPDTPSSETLRKTDSQAA